MNKNIEEIYNQSLEMLFEGKSEQEILAHFKDDQNELAPLLKISNNLFSIPTNPVPTPLMKRKYAAESESVWLFPKFLLSKFSIASIGFTIIFGALFGIGYAANLSSPGDKLFTLKKSAENIQLAFAGNQDARATLEIRITQKRLQEAQAVLANPTSNPEQKSAALDELSNQTTVAIAEVVTVTKNNPQSNQSHPLLTSLDDITKQQQTLLSKIQPNEKIQSATDKALASLTESTAQISQIKNKVAVADNDQALATLNSNPDSVSVFGQITKLSDNQINVEKTTFILTAQTIIQNLEGTILSFKDLSVNQKVSARGIKNTTTNAITAKFIVIASNGSVEGASTTTPETTTPTILPIIKKDDFSQPTSTLPQTVNPNSANGSFILESPAPQFAN